MEIEGYKTGNPGDLVGPVWGSCASLCTVLGVSSIVRQIVFQEAGRRVNLGMMGLGKRKELGLTLDISKRGRGEVGGGEQPPFYQVYFVSHYITCFTPYFYHQICGSAISIADPASRIAAEECVDVRKVSLIEICKA